MDYCRFYDENGVKHETLPLYNKSCIAYSPESGYHAFRLSLTGGSITFPGLPAISFTESDVNAADDREVIVFTPMHTPGDENADHYSFTDEMPENRLNVAIIGETVVAAREGSILLPSIGAVLSLSGTWADTLKGYLGKTDKNGYFDVSLCKKLQISVNPPAGMDEEAFRSFTWVYGGGLGLINGDDVMSAENYLEMIREEGWRTLLSR